MSRCSTCTACLAPTLGGMRLIPLHLQVAYRVQNVMATAHGLLGSSRLPRRCQHVVDFLQFVALLDGEFLALSRAHLGHELVEDLLLVRLHLF